MCTSENLSVNETNRCTCGCPDGPEQHLENCEVYLRYWEVDQLERIRIRYHQIVQLFPVPERDCVIVRDLINRVVSFVQSAGADTACISDPAYVIRHYIADREADER